MYLALAFYHHQCIICRFEGYTLVLGQVAAALDPCSKHAGGAAGAGGAGVGGAGGGIIYSRRLLYRQQIPLCHLPNLSGC